MIEDFPIGKAHLLKLSEHGSKYSTKPNLIKTVEPAFVAICNKHHDTASGEVMERFKNVLGRKPVALDTKKEKRDIKVSTDGIARNGKVSYKITFTRSDCDIE